MHQPCLSDENQKHIRGLCKEVRGIIKREGCFVEDRIAEPLVKELEKFINNFYDGTAR